MDEFAKRARIARLIRIYGADFDRWPSAEGLGRPLIDAAADPALAAARAEEAELDALIESAAVPPPSAALAPRLLAIARDERQIPRGVFWLLSGFWRPAGVAAGALAVGLFLGQLSLAQASVAAAAEAQAATDFSALVLGALDDPGQALAEFPR